MRGYSVDSRSLGLTRPHSREHALDVLRERLAQVPFQLCRVDTVLLRESLPVELVARLQHGRPYGLPLRTRECVLPLRAHLLLPSAANHTCMSAGVALTSQRPEIQYDRGGYSRMMSPESTSLQCRFALSTLTPGTPSKATWLVNLGTVIAATMAARTGAVTRCAGAGLR